MSKEILLNKLEKQFSYYELVDEMQETINYSKIIDFLDNEKDQKIADLEAKLAESEKDRLMWQEMYKNADRQNKVICETDIYPLQEENTQLKQQLAEKNKEIEELKSKHQDKISFCIERLEKTKEKFGYKYNSQLMVSSKGLCDFIDNQIKQIKEIK